ncbi:MAG: FAD-dependent oxidoreductase [Bacteroidales bacterium]
MDFKDFQTLVIGGGIAGITAAVELAETGIRVALVEKEPYLGGNVSKLNNYFPKLCPPSCGLEINYRRIRSNPGITCITGAEATNIEGSEGDFRVKVSLAPALINTKCTACGKCAEVCPSEQLPEPGSAIAKRSAYIRSSLPFPFKYAIDPETCLGEVCKKCIEVCEYDAINLGAKASQIELKARNVIVSTGWESYDATRIENYCYAGEPDVVTNMEFEKLLSTCTKEGKRLGRPSDGKFPESIAFVQCAGSRDVKYLSYCSAVCCTASVKHALTLAEAYPDLKSEIFYIDLRLQGRNEKLLSKAEETPTITLTKGKVGRIEKRGHEVILEVEDILAGRKRMESFHMVVLATGMVPSKVLPDLSVNQEGFLNAVQKRGIYPTSSCRRPMDVTSSVKDATATVLRSMKKDHE